MTIASPAGMGFEVTGLAAGERVVAAGGHRLEDGQRVRVYRGLTTGERP